MTRTLLISAAIVMMFAAATQAQPLPAAKIPAFAVPHISKAPTIDGKMEDGEWKEAVAVSGVSNQLDNSLVPRPTTYYLAWDADHIYLACRTWVMPGYKPRASGRLPHIANVGDDSMELHFQPLGKNVPTGKSTESSYKFCVNALGFDGDLFRVSVGQSFRNWTPKFKMASSQTKPGSAPGEGSWLIIEMSGTPKDFELDGPNRAGDTWKMMLGFDQLPAWMQARIPCNSGYFDAAGYPLATLVEKTPAVQVTMDDLPGPCDGVAAVKISAYNPTDKAVTLKALLQFAAVANKKVEGKDVLESTDVIKEEPTLTVEPGKSAEFTLNKKLDNPALKDGGSIYFSVMQGDKQLFQYFTYFKVQDTKPFLTYTPPKEAFPFTAQFNPIRCTLQLSGDAYYLADPDAVKGLKYFVISAKSERTAKAVAEGVIERQSTHIFRQMLQLPNLAEGEYVVNAWLVTKDGKEIGPVQSKFSKLDEAKEFAAWWNTKLGNIERVIPPFEAMTCKDNVVTVIGRSYKLDALGLPADVTSQKASVLAAGARIVVVVNGKKESIPLDGELKITEQKAWRVSFEGLAKGAGLVFMTRGWVEQDGLCYIDLTYTPEGQKAITVDALRVEFPFAADQAQALLCIGAGGNFSTRTTELIEGKPKQGRLWGTLDMGRAGSMMKVGSFFPVVWLGNDERGLMWWGDNDKGWVPNDLVSAHEVFREGDQVVLRNNIIGAPFKLDAPRTISFGYNASPFKPLAKSSRRIMGSWDGTFTAGPDYDKVGFKQRRDPKTGVVFDGAEVLTPPSADVTEWPAIWAQYKTRADKKVKEMILTDPQGARNGWWVHTSLSTTGDGWKSSDQKTTGYFAAEWGDREGYVPTNIDYYLCLINRAINEGGLRTIYWDIFFPSEHYTVQNGMAYELPDGRVQPGYAGFNTRRFMMRTYSLFDENHLYPGAQVTHATNAYLLVAVPWTDAILDGEFHKLTNESKMDWVDGYPIDRMRVLSVGGQWGTTISWMDHIFITEEKRAAQTRRGMLDYIRMYDSWTGPSIGVPPQNLVDFGLLDPKIQYVPFWRNPFATSDKDILVSMWRTDDRVIIGVFNYSKKQTDATIKLDLAKLFGKQLETAELAGRDMIVPMGDPATKYDLTAGNITLPALAGHTGRIIAIRATDKAAMKTLEAPLAELVKLTIRPSATSTRQQDSVQTMVIDGGFVTAKTEVLPAGKLAEVTCDDADVQIAAWRLPDRVLLIVKNTNEKQAKNASLKIDLKKLGLYPAQTWVEFVNCHAIDGGTEPTFDAAAGTVEVKEVPAKGARVITVRKF